MALLKTHSDTIIAHYDFILQDTCENCSQCGRSVV